MSVLSYTGGRIARVSVVPSGGPLVGQEYLKIYDQTGKAWYWWISYDLATEWSNEPEQALDQEIRLYLEPWWIKLRDSDAGVWYLYPDTIDGAPLVSTSQPATGPGVANSPHFRARGGRLRYKFQIEGGDLNVVPA